MKQKKKQMNSLNINNETKGCSASTLSIRDIQNIKSNSKRESNSDMSNLPTNYKTQSITKKKKIHNETNQKKENMTLQSLSDSKMMELAEFFLDKKEKDDLLDDISIKKILVFNNSSKYRNKSISFI